MVRRREVLAMAAVAAASPGFAFAPPAPAMRQPWRAFRAGPDYLPFVKAIGKLKDNVDPKSPDSWSYWANIHQDQCPHGKPYFLGWHRGFLHLFERKLQQVARKDSLRLPYWDYFAEPDVPPEFTQGNVSSNPLFEPRIGSNVAKAIDYSPFAATVTRFDRGPANAFEALIETIPHNRVHNLIGGVMATPLSPLDPLFWLHHANVDRLWAAWLAAGHGRTMPAAGKPYWADSFDYGPQGKLPRAQMIAPAGLGYGYADEQLPAPQPPRVGAANTASAVSGGAAARPRARAPQPSPPPPPPPMVMMAAPPPMRESAGRGVNPSVYSLIPSGRLLLGGESFSVRVPLSPRVSPLLAPLMAPPPPPAPPPGAAAGPPVVRSAAPAPAPVPPPPDSYSIVMDEVSLTSLGAEGGFFFNVYLNLPTPGGDDGQYLVGSIGAFEIASAKHHAAMGAMPGMPGMGDTVRLELPVDDKVAKLLRGRELQELSISFVRVDADGAPSGEAISIGHFRVEAVAPRAD